MDSNIEACLKVVTGIPGNCWRTRCHSIWLVTRPMSSDTSGQKTSLLGDHTVNCDLDSTRGTPTYLVPQENKGITPK